MTKNLLFFNIESIKHDALTGCALSSLFLVHPVLSTRTSTCNASICPLDECRSSNASSV